MGIYLPLDGDGGIYQLGIKNIIMFTIFGFSPVLFLVLLFSLMAGIIIGKIFKFFLKSIIFLSAAIFIMMLSAYYFVWKIFLEPAIGHF